MKYSDMKQAVKLLDKEWNLGKKGIEGYIEYESFAELSNLVVRKIQVNDNHKIYIYKMPSKEVGCYAEIAHFLELGYIELYRKRND